jgi:ArsR family transcriptional regulator
MTDRQEIERCARGLDRCRPLLVAMGDETRQHIVLQMLHNDGDCTGMRVPQIASLTHLSRPAVSHHLQILKDADVVKVRREGTRNYYFFASDHAVADLIQTLQLAQRLMQVHEPQDKD